MVILKEWEFIIIIIEKGDIYEGEWKNGKQEGKGIYYYNYGDREMGDYLVIQ